MLLSHLQDAALVMQLGVIGALFIAGLVKGAIGIGMPIIGLPLLAALVGVQAAAMILSVPLFLSNIPQALEGGRTRDSFVRLAPILAGALPGIAAGVYVLDLLPPRALYLFVGTTLILATILLLVTPRLSMRESRSRSLDAAVGFTSGIIGGPVALPSNLVFTYLLAQGMRGAAFTKHASLFVMCAAAWLALALTATKSFGPTDLLVSTICVLPVLAGMQFGQKLRDVMSGDLFKWLVLAAVLAAALDLIRRGLFG